MCVCVCVCVCVVCECVCVCVHTFYECVVCTYVGKVHYMCENISVSVCM